MKPHIPAYMVHPPLGNDQKDVRITLCDVGLPWVFLGIALLSNIVGFVLGYLLGRGW